MRDTGLFIISGSMDNVMRFVHQHIRAYNMTTGQRHNVLMQDQGDKLLCSFTEWFDVNKRLELKVNNIHGVITGGVDVYPVNDGIVTVVLPMISEWRNFMLSDIVTAQVNAPYDIFFDMKRGEYDEMGIYRNYELKGNDAIRMC